jgi:hypothetical protein
MRLRAKVSQESWVRKVGRHDGKGADELQRYMPRDGTKSAIPGTIMSRKSPFHTRDEDVDVDVDGLSLG